MTRTLADFPDLLTSRSCNAAMVFNIGDHNSALYAAFLYAEHQLYKIVAVDDSLSEAHDVADMIAVKFSGNDPEFFSDWIEAEFPEDVNYMSRQQIADMFA